MSEGERKDRLVQARVPEALETTLKAEARRRRTTVSQLVRDLLEDTFQLVDGVVSGVDRLVGGSVELAQQVRRDARRLGETARGRRAPCLPPRPDAAERLAPVAAWNPVVLNQPVPCAKCGAELPRGGRAWMGVGSEPGQPPAWLCGAAVEALGDADDAESDEPPSGETPD